MATEEGMPETEKMKKQQPAAAPTLPVSVSVEKKHHQPQPTCVAIPLYTLLNAAVFFFSGIIWYVVDAVSPPRQATWEYTLISALVDGMLWCSTPQAVAGALALLHPCHHRCWFRRAAAYTAFAFTVASHCMLAAVVVVVVTIDPRDHLFFMIAGSESVFVVAVDVIIFLALLRSSHREITQQ